jgi:hypothetical protein
LTVSIGLSDEALIAAVAPVSGDDEQHAADREREARHDRPHRRELELGEIILFRRRPDVESLGERRR